MRLNYKKIMINKENPEYINWLKESFIKTFERPILESFLDIKLIDLEEGKSTFSCYVDDLHTNLFGIAHGGVLASICDTAMGSACVTYGKKLVTLDMSISYIKSAPKGSIIIAKAEVISIGNTIVRAEAKVYNNNHELLALSQASYFIKGDFSEK